ncbi:glycosyltransferase family 2 protein [Roseobacter sp.]|uniref:glycosyltransferase family 2 protein n=1 Tax=Roseobacter sp. TaxID=1907202 RepID=UPI0032999418
MALTAPISPQVSVLMAVFNGARYVESALASIQNQTLDDIEIIVVDDASQDETPQILAKIAAADPRIHVETLSENLGVAGAANRGLDLARAPYVARMDSDDISMPDRLAHQKAYLDTHDTVMLIGSSIGQIDAEGAHLRTSHRPRDAFSCRWLARFFYPVTHPSTMFRRVAPDGTPLRYADQMRTTLDYEFFARVLAHGEAVSTSDILLNYRIHDGSISGTKYRDQATRAQKIALGVQDRELPPKVRASLEPFNAAYLGFSAAPPAAIFAAMRQMIAYDAASHPDRRTWMRRQASQLLLSALQRSGLSRKQARRAFLRHGVDFLPALALRAAELKRMLPAALRSDPPV